MRHDEDVRDGKYTAYQAKTQAMISKIFAQFSFIEPELTALDESVLNGYIQDPDFAEYDYRLQKIAKGKSHVLFPVTISLKHH